MKAKTQLSLDHVRLQPDGTAEVSGQLLDQLTGAGIPRQRVRIIVAGMHAEVDTDENGKFTKDLPIPEGTQTFQLQYGGAASLDASQLTTTTDPSKAQVALAIAVDDAPSGATITVTGTVDDAPTALQVELAVGDPGEAQLRTLTTLATDTPYLVTRKIAGGAGQRRVRATFPGDSTRQPATAEVMIDLTSSSRTTIHASTTTLAYEDELAIDGTVVDEDNAPIARSAVTLVAGDRRLAQGATDEDGSFTFEIEAELLGTGQYALQVRADPATSYIKRSQSDPVFVAVAAPHPVPVSYTIIAFVATGLAAGGFLMARAKPWTRVRKQVRPAEEPVDQGEAEQIAGGLVAARPGIVSTLRRAADDGFAGVVRDTVRGRPVSEATVRLVLGDVERAILSARDGSFALENLTPGEWRAEVGAAGHVTERFTVTIPHRGELRGARIDLVPVRERVFQLYRRAAEPILPEPRLWGIWSPRQVVDHVRAKRPSPALAELTDFVEEVYFSPRLSPEAILDSASARVDNAVRERARPQSSPQTTPRGP
ncbi:MAG: carboxypeptidase-like regulatory domain-containing protein [Kofleriaceae bacterium]